MREDFLQYVWQYRLWDSACLFTTNGDEVEVINPGRLNRDAGPDFFNAKIRISGTLWAGNVEIHCRSSDWYKHKHDADGCYDSVILHVVTDADCDVSRTTGEAIPQMVMKMPEHLHRKVGELFNSTHPIRCGIYWSGETADLLRLSYHRLVCTRLERKSAEIDVLLKQSSGNWANVLYISLARNFGMNVNALPFELLAKSLPISCISKHKDNRFQVEALVFGQSGLLEVAEPVDDYTISLKKEYDYLKQKFSLSPISASHWRFARMRPQNSPCVRLSQFADLIFRSVKLFSRIIETDKIERLRQMFYCESSAYWTEHYSFGELVHGRRASGVLGAQSVDTLIINTVVPIIFLYSRRMSDDVLLERAFSLLEQMPAERNSVVMLWQSYGVQADTAFQSQALIEQKKVYCDQNKCFCCTVGHCVLSEKNVKVNKLSKKE